VLSIAEALTACLLVSLVLRAPVFALLATTYLIAAALFIVACVAFPVVGGLVVIAIAIGACAQLDRARIRY
jgi:hypothetical protein